MIRSRTVRAALAALTTLALCTPLAPALGAAQPQAVPTFTITGSGYGHGIGMSQYGAQGYAIKGSKYDAILKHYYQGTSLATMGAADVKVNIDKAYTGSSYAGQYGWTMKGVATGLYVYQTTDPSVNKTLSADTFYVFKNEGSKVVVRTESGSLVKSFSGDVWVKGVSDGSLVEVKNMITGYDSTGKARTAGTGPFGYVNVRYRGRFLVHRRSGDRLDCINYLSMQAYLYGVVPREMPSGWRAEALKAQAVAARSYAYVDVRNGAVLKCTVYSQVYGGHSRVSQGVVQAHEAAATNAAVDATRDKVLKSGSTWVKAFFFSQSGGHTANVEDVWTGNTAHESWLRGVPDPYETVAGAGLVPWPSSVTDSLKLSGQTLADMLKAGGVGVPTSGGKAYPVTGARVERASSGYARYVTFTFSNGASVKVSGDKVRTSVKYRKSDGSTSSLPSSKIYLLGFPMERVAGTDRYATALTLSQRAFPSTAPAVVLASGEAYPDALTGSGLAGAAGGPLLLTARDSLSADTAAELQRLQPSRIYVVGGASVVTDRVLGEAASAVAGVELTRVAGEDRYATSIAVARVVSGLAQPDRAIFVNGTSWPDAAAASALAYALPCPIILTERHRLGMDALRYLADERPETTVFVGGTAVLSEGLEAVARMISRGGTLRLAGTDRYATAVKVADYELSAAGFSPEEVYLATGYDYPDALTGGVAAGKLRRPLLLTAKDSAPAGTVSFLKGHQSAIDKLVILGGPPAISQRGIEALDLTMMR